MRFIVVSTFKIIDSWTGQRMVKVPEQLGMVCVLEAIQIELVAKGEKVPASMIESFIKK